MARRAGPEPLDGSAAAAGDESSHLRKRQREEQDNDGLASRTRRKTACQPCRMRKTKCEGTRPTCSVCSSTARRCEYIDPLPEKLTLETATNLITSKLEELKKEVGTLASSFVRPSECDRGSFHPSTGLAVREQLTNPDLPFQTAATTTEPAKDFLQIPAHRTTSDTVLAWPIFGGHFPSMSLLGPFIGHYNEEQSQDAQRTDDFFMVEGGISSADEEQLPNLVDCFLQNVHTKNPILDVEQLVLHVRKIASEGLRWDPWSCLILMAAALGSIAKPFNAAVVTSPTTDQTSPTFIQDRPATRGDLKQGESYFILGCRRLGCLKYSIIGAQCFFFAGVYLMYTLRPFEAWPYFNQSSVLYQLYMKIRYGLTGHSDEIHDNDTGQKLSKPSDADRIVNQQRLEETLYWSCFKSECEFRVELPLPQTEIATYHHSQMFPSPPSPAAGGSQEDGSLLDHTSPATSITVLPITSEEVGMASSSTEQSRVRHHAKRLCNEEESWYYYLTEIALRRIGNRIINTFFDRSPSKWMDIRPLLHIALEFETQVSAWSANLPTAMQHWETTYTIRAPPLDYFHGGPEKHVSRELSWAIDNRLLEMRSWLYQPFLYNFIHNGHGSLDDQARPPHTTYSAAPLSTQYLSSEDAAAFSQLVRSGIECNLKILDVRSLRHRHHGLWFDMRSIVCASVILLGIVHSGKEDWIPGGAEALWGLQPVDGPSTEEIDGKIGQALGELEFWSAESPMLKRHQEVLNEVARMVKGERLARQGHCLRRMTPVEGTHDP